MQMMFSEARVSRYVLIIKHCFGAVLRPDSRYGFPNEIDLKHTGRIFKD